MFETKLITGTKNYGADWPTEIDESYWPSVVICLPIDEYEVLDYDAENLPVPKGADAVVKTDRGAQYYFFGEDAAQHDDRMRCDDKHWEMSHSQGFWTVRVYGKERPRKRRVMKPLSEVGLALAAKWHATAEQFPEIEE